MRKSLSFITMLLVATLIAACGGQQARPQPTAAPAATTAPAQPTEADCPKPEVLCVGLVTDVGEVDDKSFNQSAWEGVKRAERELGAIVNYVETKDAKDYDANIALFTEKGYDVIITVGFALGEATVTMTSYP